MGLIHQLFTLLLTREFCNPLDDWLESTSLTNYPEDYKIRGLIQKLKIYLLTPGLIYELCNPFDDSLESTSPTKHPGDYIICGLTRELKIWLISLYKI